MKGKAQYERYRMLADERGWSDYRTSKETGIAQETLSSWKKGKYVPKTDKLQILADKFDVDVDFFYNEETLKDRIINDSIAPAVVKMQRVFEVAAGDGKCPIEDEFKQEDGKFAKVVGDSMYPVLHDGDIVRIVEATDLKLKDIVLVKINGDENTLKYAEVLPDGIWISAENKDVFKDRFFTMEMVLTLPVQIVGKAVEIVSRKL